MKKLFSKSLCIICIMTFITALCAVNVSAASASSAISASPSSVTVGNTFTVTVKVSCASIGSAEGSLTYDSSVIEFVSGSDAAGASGSLKLSKYASSDGVGSFTFSLTFKALKAGSTTVTFTPTEVANWSTEIVSCSSASTKVTVTSPAALSSNANLKSLKVSSGTLSPAFSPNTVNYTVTVPYTVTKLTMSATTEDSAATLSVSGSQNLSVGKNVRAITVKAADGTTKKYTVTVTRQANDGTVSETPVTSQPTVESEQPSISNTVTVTVDGEAMTVVEDLSEVTLPAGFTVDEVTINDKAVICIKNASGLKMLYLNDGETNCFYIYDSENISFTKYRTITVKGASYVLVDKPRNTAVPEGFTSTEVRINETDVPAWQASGEEFKDFYLIYVSSESGNLGFYLYDSAEDTIERYVDFGSLSEPAVTEPQKEDPFYVEYSLYIIIALGVVAVGLAGALTVVIMKKRAVNQNDSKDDLSIDENINSINFDFDDDE